MIAEFNHKTYKDHKIAFQNSKAFESTARQKDRFERHFNEQLIRLQSFTLVRKITQRPVLIISYEDMLENLFPQILRIANFMELGEDLTVLDRSVCTIFNAEAMRKTDKRKYSEDFTPTAANLVNRKWATAVLKTISENFLNYKLHEMRLDDYIESLSRVTKE